MTTAGHEPGEFDLRLVAPFVIFAEELHVGRAAERLGLAQPALSQQLTRLERQLGVALITRHGRRLSLTPAGARFLWQCRKIVERAQVAEDAVRSGGGLRVHLGVHPALLPIVTGFMAENPAIAVTVTGGTGTGSMRALAHGEADVGFDLPGGVPPGMSYAVLDRAPLGAVTAQTHPLARHSSARWTAIESMPVFVAPAGIADAWNDSVRTALRRAGIAPDEVVGPAVPKALYLLPLIADGRGILLLARWLLDPVPEGFAWTPLTPLHYIESGVVWDNNSGNEALHRFVAWAKERAPVNASATRSGSLDD